MSVYINYICWLFKFLYNLNIKMEITVEKNGKPSINTPECTNEAVISALIELLLCGRLSDGEVDMVSHLVNDEHMLETWEYMRERKNNEVDQNWGETVKIWWKLFCPSTTLVLNLTNCYESVEELDLLQFNKLEILDLHWNKDIRVVKNLPQTLKLININKTLLSHSSIDLSTATNLKALFMEECVNFEELKCISKNLVLLDAQCSWLKKVSCDLSECTNLTSVDVSFCAYLESLWDLPEWLEEVKATNSWLMILT